MGADVETVSTSSPTENDPWGWARAKISSCCDVAVFTTERESRSARACGHREARGAFKQGSTLLITWMKAKTPGAME